MKTLFEYLINRNTKPLIQWQEKSSNLKYASIRGHLSWRFESKEYQVKDNIDTDNWYVGVYNEDIVIFWSKYSPWMFYFYIHEANKKNKIDWALVGRTHNELNDILNAIEKWDGDLMQGPTVPVVDYMYAPNAIEPIITSILKNKPVY